MRTSLVPATSLLVMAAMAAPAAQAQSYSDQNYPAQSYPAQGYPAQSYPAQSYPGQQGYPASSYPAQGYPNQAYPAPGNGQQFRDAPPYNDLATDPDGYAAPPGYDGTQLPPPPPGYVAQQGQAYVPTDQDRRYEAYVEDWSQRYCVKSRSNAGTGAVIGGLFGALLGAGVSGRHNEGTGALVGGLAGAAGGAVVGSTTANQTSPGCPPGFVVRGGAPAFYYDGYDTGYLYAAPAWYQPWFFYGGRWAYRPYPYHAFYYSHFGYGRGYGYGYGYRGRGGYGYRRGRY